jgi:hypothetical protein
MPNMNKIRPTIQAIATSTYTVIRVHMHILRAFHKPLFRIQEDWKRVNPSKSICIFSPSECFLVYITYTGGKSVKIYMYFFTIRMFPRVYNLYRRVKR